MLALLRYGREEILCAHWKWLGVMRPAFFDSRTRGQQIVVEGSQYRADKIDFFRYIDRAWRRPECRGLGWNENPGLRP